MRDIKRIDPLMKKITELWKQFPDLRFMQLMDTVSSLARKKYKKDVFYLEDDELDTIIDGIEKGEL
jgi:uncharacterized protein YihD (DUF1040 family)